MENPVEHLYRKSAIIALWILGVVISGIAAGASASGWIALAGVAALPPVVMLWFWAPPAATISERIQRARR